MTFSAATKSTTPVWSIPISIMDLLEQVDVFRINMSTITTLRLCHRFGEGENAHITKIPKEILALVEDAFMSRFRERYWSRWPGEYCCFEGSCRPSDHIYHQRYEALRDEALGSICEDHHLDYEQLTETPIQDLPDGVIDLVAMKADRLCAGNWAGLFDGIIERGLRWPERIAKVKGEYEELLLKHFGLGVLIMNETMSDEALGYILRNDNRFMKNRTPPEQVTICHLILPASTLNSVSDLDGFHSHRKRFARAMNILNLEPTVHPCLLDDIPSVSPCQAHNTTRIATSNSETEEKDTATKQRIRDLEKSEWPKLMYRVEK